MKNKAASELGKLAKGIPKRISAHESNRRRLSLEQARKNRWPASLGGKARQRKKAQP